MSSARQAGRRRRLRHIHKSHLEVVVVQPLLAANSWWMFFVLRRVPTRASVDVAVVLLGALALALRALIPMFMFPRLSLQSRTWTSADLRRPGGRVTVRESARV